MEVKKFKEKGKKINVQSLDTKSLNKLVEELEVHQIELEMQNNELQEIQRKLKKSKDQYYELYDEAPAAYMTLNKKGRILLINQTGAEILGETKEKVSGKKITRFIDSRNQDIFYFHFQKVWNEGEKSVCEIRLNTGSFESAIVRVESVLADSLETEEKVIRSVFSDITREKRAEEFLRGRENLLQNIIERIPAGVCITDEKGMFEYANPVYCEIHGYGLEEIIGSHFTLTVKDGDKEYFSELYGRFMAGEETPQTVWTLLNKKGEEKQVLSDGILITDLNGAKKRVTFEVDITELKDKEKALLESNESLRQFASVISHDLKQPLSSLMGFFSLIKVSLERGMGSPEELSKTADYGVQISRQMTRLIDDLLYYSKLETGRARKEKVNLNDVLQTVVLGLKNEMEKHGAEIDVGKLPEIQGDRSRVHQLFQNLISNSLKYRKKEVSPCIEIGLDNSRPGHTLFVRDNGIGISAEKQENVFQMFYRAHDNKDFEGTGLGLATCKKIAQLHDGKIWLESEPGKGSTFYLYIPSE
jgi:PAS domain S-box-containing protein